MSSTFKKKRKRKKVSSTSVTQNIEYVFFGMLLKNRATE